MDVIIVPMYCGASGRPFRIIFARESVDAPYTAVAIEPGSGVTVSATPLNALPTSAPAGNKSRVASDEIALRDVAWPLYACPICGNKDESFPFLRCASCHDLLCPAARSADPRRPSFRCPRCGFKAQESVLFGNIRRIFALRWRRPSRPAPRIEGARIALPPAGGLLPPGDDAAPGHDRLPPGRR